MTKYKLFTVKRYLEQCFMFPFVLFGRLWASTQAKTDFDIFFFIPIYGLGGAEYVNAKILEAIPDQKILLVFTKQSSEATALALFQHPNVSIEIWSKWMDNKFLYWANFIMRGFFAQRIKTNIRPAKVFIGQCNFGYKLSPHLQNKTEVLELIHLFDEKFCNVWMPFVSFLNKRICVAQTEIDKILAYSDRVGIPAKFKSCFSELKLFVDIPIDIVPTNREEDRISIYYAGRGTAQKRLWLSFEIAKRVKQLGLAADFFYVGNFQDELPFDFSNYAHYTPALSMGNEMYHFIKDKHVLLLTSDSEGFPIALLEAMHFGIVPVVTPVGGMPNVIRHLENGVLLDNSTENTVIDSAIEAIKILSENTTLRHKLSRNIKTTFKQDFSKQQFEKFIRQYFSE